jgi:GH25 family lysozyme M1 (1,4-beta-N-acetylmuramidase)
MTNAISALETLHIIDLSEANGDVQWSRVGRWVGKNGERIGAAILKATEGNDYIDTQCKANTIGAAACDLLLGWYHFAHPDAVHIDDARGEARHFVAVVRAAGFIPGKHILALDIEEARKITPGPAFARWVLAFCDAVEELTQCVCFIYTGGPFFDSNSGHLSADELAALARHPLWLAAYVTNPARYIPAPWKTSGQTLHQESGDIGPPNLEILHAKDIWGGAGNIDHDVYAGTIEMLRAVITRSYQPTTPPPVPDFGEDTPATSIADEVHTWIHDRDDEEADTEPQTPIARTKSSQRLAAVRAPILGVNDDKGGKSE